MNVVEAKGARIPAMGLGTMSLKEQVCIDTVKTALKLGYRHLDTAERYGNEEWVGEGLRQGLAATGLKREDVFLVTKVLPGNATSRKRIVTSCEGSLRRLRTDRIDLYLLHWRQGEDLGLVVETFSGLVQMDLKQINQRNSPAGAILVSQLGGKNFAGTAFAIDSGFSKRPRRTSSIA